jgi:lipoprotein NlpI
MALRNGNGDKALEEINRAIKAAPDQSQMYLIRGSLLFRSGKIEQSLPDFDKVIEIDPAVKPYLWQRGIALYYAGKYQEGLDQFAVHRDVNPNDVENAFWHFLCNTKLKGLKAAQTDVLLSGKDQRVPMMQVQDMIQGKATVEQVIAAAEKNRKLVDGADYDRFYGYLYVGLYYDAIGNRAKALEWMEKCVALGVDGYMGDVAKVHLDTLKKDVLGTNAPNKQKGKWVSLFNGKDLTGWTPKIRGFKLGENYANTFRVQDGMICVRYDGYEKFDERFGHLFFDGVYSKYRLRIEYRFVGEQAPGGPGWAIRNSGVMLHGQRPETMTIDQDFPCSIEAQFLGGNGQDPRTTLNLCTPGTHVEIDGKLFTPHCTGSKSKTYHGDQWVTAEFEVLGNEVIRHSIDGQVVLEYQKPQLDPGDANAKPLIRDGMVQIDRGTISLQSESHPIDFRKVEIMVLE